MAVKIRLSRIGAKGNPIYRVVVADERTARNGKVIEIIGEYNARMAITHFKVDKEKVLSWIKKGAQPSFIVRKLLGKAGILKAVDFTNFKKKQPKRKGAAEEKPAEAPAPVPAKP